MNQTPISLGVYRHYKGNNYKVIGFARHSETLEDMVIYKALYGDCGTWVRPLSMWENMIEVDGKTVKRFEFIDGSISLRPFCDDDIPLMEKWLAQPHVARWYQYPDHWLRELRERGGDFSFITHFIAEYGSVPVGFCQYYDCHFAQAHEVWNDHWRISERKGEVFSLDYLIGEPGYLRRGLAKEMVLQMMERLRNIGARTVIAAPEKENTASCHVLEACGFEYDGEDYVMELHEGADES